MLISEPVRGTPSTVLQVIKQDVSRLVQQTSQRSGSPFWQRRFYDFNVWTRKKKVEKLAYMHLNPVKRGLVAHPRDWPWSSYAFYEGKGQVLIGIDRVD
jgi:putative transposase